MRPMKKRKKTEDTIFKEDAKRHKKYEEEDHWIESKAGKAFFV